MGQKKRYSERAARHTRRRMRRSEARRLGPANARRESAEPGKKPSRRQDLREPFCEEKPERFRTDCCAEATSAGILPLLVRRHTRGNFRDGAQIPRRAWRRVRHRDSREGRYAWNHSSREASWGEECVSARWSRWRARASADMTVPIGMAVMEAISL